MKLLLILIPFVLFALERITPIPTDVVYDAQKAALGKALFFDPILSVDNTVSCFTCHNLPGSGADGLSFSFGVNGAEGSINAPSVLNSSLNFVQFWNGRAKSLAEQALGPIVNPIEMANTLDNVEKTLKSSAYKARFEAIYPDGVTIANLADAIAEFEKALLTPNSRFDRYLRGEEDALNAQEIRGYETFKSIGCISCHNGVNVGGNMYQKFGIFKEYKQKKESLGRYEVTKRERDRYVFKVPSLRNVALTPPYFHDGRVNTLAEAIFEMQEHQLGIVPKKEFTEDIEAFLNTLTGETPAIVRD